MRFLLDNNLSRRVADLLRAAGHDVVHVGDIGLHAAPDEAVLDEARTNMRVLVSADTDFGTLLARFHATAPSFVLMRRAAGRRASDQSRLILDNLASVRDELEVGAVVVLGDTTVRVRQLPIAGS